MLIGVNHRGRPGPRTPPPFPHRFARQELNALRRARADVTLIQVVTDEHGAPGLRPQLANIDKIDLPGPHTAVARGFQLKECRTGVVATGDVDVVAADDGRADVGGTGDPGIVPEFFARLGVYADHPLTH